MKLWILSDLHQEFAEFAWRPKSVPEHDVLILAGDIHAGAENAVPYAASLTDKPIILIAGNHEFYGQEITGTIARLRALSENVPHVHFLENDAETIGDIRFIGATLWTDLRLQDYLPAIEVARNLRRGMNDYRRIKILRSDGVRRKRLDPRHTRDMHFASRAFITRELEAQQTNARTVVATHHVPDIVGCPQEFHHDPLAPAYASNLTHIIKQYQPILWIHGHTHYCHQSRIGETMLVSNARGYMENAGRPFDPEFVLEV